jgi:hypothetical protein
MVPTRDWGLRVVNLLSPSNHIMAVTGGELADVDGSRRSKGGAELSMISRTCGGWQPYVGKPIAL